MKNEIQQILKIVKDEQRLNADRYGELNHQYGELNGRYDELNNRYGELKSQTQEILKIVTNDQERNAHRYHELKSAIDDIKLTILPTLATKEQLNQVYESLSQDITYLSGDHHKLRRRVDLLEKK